MADFPVCNIRCSQLNYAWGGYVSLESVTEPEILEILQPMIKRYALEREEGEHFGDFVIRAGYIAPTLSGLTWYDRMGGEGVHRDVAVAA